jgi:hypothetical protein
LTARKTKSARAGWQVELEKFFIFFSRGSERALWHGDEAHRRSLGIMSGAFALPTHPFALKNRVGGRKKEKAAEKNSAALVRSSCQLFLIRIRDGKNNQAHMGEPFIL